VIDGIIMQDSPPQILHGFDGPTFDDVADDNDDIIDNYLLQL